MTLKGAGVALLISRARRRNAEHGTPIRQEIQSHAVPARGGHPTPIRLVGTR